MGEVAPRLRYSPACIEIYKINGLMVTKLYNSFKKVYSYLVGELDAHQRHNQIAGKSVKFSTTTLSWKHYRGTRLIADPNGNKVENRTIRSQVPKWLSIHTKRRMWARPHGKGSETKWLWGGHLNPP
jgi:hypothetical protein